MSSYKSIQAERLYERIVEQIEQSVLKGDLSIGDRLPAERELAEQFGVSRTAVREAVKALREKGLVEVMPGRGTFITDGTSNAVRDSLGLMMSFSQVDGFRNLEEIREILEPEIAALAAQRHDDDDIVRMQTAIATMDTAIYDVERYIEADMDFHLALADATRNALILLLLDPIVGLLDEQRKRIFLVKGGAERGQQHHKHILAAVISSNPTAARKAMQAHLTQIRTDLGLSQSKT